MKKRRFVVIDTNVAIVANKKHELATVQDVLACIAALEDARDCVILIDRNNQVLSEYRKHLSPKGQPGVGDSFMKWLWDNRANSKRCLQISITPLDSGSYSEFPDDSRLAAFDKADRKFVAIAKASGRDPKILNACDSDWWDFELVLAEHAIRVDHVAPDFRATWSNRPQLS